MTLHLNKEDIHNLEKVFRLNLINSLTGIRPVNVIGTQNSSGQTNLAVFSSVTHLGSNPALFGLIVRPTDQVPRNTYTNIQETGFFTINQVHKGIINQSHQTSAKYKADESEFDQCGFKEQWLDHLPAPYVKESRLKFGLRFLEIHPIKRNGTQLLIGEVEHIYLPEECLDDRGYVDSHSLQTTGVVGLNNYYQLTHIRTLPYARREHK